MPSIYVQKNSPFYWIRLYDKYEPEQSKRKKRINSKIALSPTDKKKIESWIKSGAVPEDKPKIHGNEQTKRLLQQLSNGLVEKDVLKKTNINIRIKVPIKLSEATKEYVDSKIRLGDKKSIKKKTSIAYINASNRFIEATGKDVEVHKYLPADFSSMLAFMEIKDLSEPTRFSYTNHLHVLWNYFIAKNYATQNIIEIYDGGKTKKPEDIPLDEFKIILKYYEKRSPEKWEWIYYLLLSMNRPSTAILQERSKINFVQKYVEMLNQKETRKKSRYYIYPLFREFEELIKRIMERPDSNGSGRLFSHFYIGEINFTDAFRWWYSDQRKLVLAELISKPYQMKQIRKTLPSFALNVLGFSQEELKFLLDHTNEEVTENHYLNVKYDLIRKRFEQRRIFERDPGEAIQPFSAEEVKPAALSNEEIQEKIDSIVKKARVKIPKSELAAYLKEKLPITQIAKKYGVSDVAIHKWIVKYKLKKN
jgi:hypothetical protein